MDTVPATADEQRTVMFAEQKTELLKRQLLNSDNFDKAVLAYSTAGLGFSLAFLKDFLPIAKALANWLLYSSWALFVLSIVLTIVSFIASQRGIVKQLNLSERYYLKKDESALTERNLFSEITDCLNNLSAVAFVAALIATTVFVSLNLERASTMAEEKKVVLREGAPIPKIIPVGDTLQKMGAPIPGIQAVPNQPIPSTQEQKPPSQSAQPADPPKPPTPAPNSSGSSGS